MNLLIAITLCLPIVSQQPQGKALTGITVQPWGFKANNFSSAQGISPDGQWVVVNSIANNIILPDTNGAIDTFIWGKNFGWFWRVSEDANGVIGNGFSQTAAVADTGNAAFESFATNLVPGDTNGLGDVFYKDWQTGAIEFVSQSTAGVLGNGASAFPRIDGSGNRIVFQSFASNLISNDANNFRDVYLRDRIAGTTSRVSVDSNGVEGDNHSDRPFISSDGRWVTFQSLATNLVAGDTNLRRDVFLRDTFSGTTLRVSVGNTGVEANFESTSMDVSDNGEWVLFRSRATNLVANDTNGVHDLFVHHWPTGYTERVSVGSGGIEANAVSNLCSLSGDARFVAFESEASNLVSGDTNGFRDVFLRDRLLDQTTRISVSAEGLEGTQISASPFISSDASQVAFSSQANNLVLNDPSDFDAFLASAGEHYRYGSGCNCSNNMTPLLFGNGSPSPASMVLFSLRNGVANATTYFYFGVNQASIPLGNGCTLLIDPVLPNPLVYTLDVNGSIDIPIYFAGNSAPGSFTMQASITDPNSGSGYCLSNGLQFTIP